MLTSRASTVSGHQPKASTNELPHPQKTHSSGVMLDDCGRQLIRTFLKILLTPNLSFNKSSTAMLLEPKSVTSKIHCNISSTIVFEEIWTADACIRYTLLNMSFIFRDWRTEQMFIIENLFIVFQKIPHEDL